MKKIALIIENCHDCPNCKRFNQEDQNYGYVGFCIEAERITTYAPTPSHSSGVFYSKDIPGWCPLKTFKD